MSNRNKTNMLAIYALGAGNFAAGMSALVMAGVLTEIATSLGVSNGQAGQLITIYSVVYAIGAASIIAFSTQHQRRLMLAAGLGFVLLGNGAAALAPSYSLLFVARIITAIGSATYVPLSAAVAISMAEPEERGRITAVVFTGFTLATALGLPIGTYIGLNFGWRFSFAFISALALISGFFVLREVSPRVQTPPVNLAIFRQVFAHGLLLLVLSVTIFQFAGQMALFAFISPWLQAFTSLGATGITLMLLFVGIGGITGNYIAGVSTDRFGAKETQLILLILLALTMAFLPTISRSLLIGSLLMFAWGAVGQGFVAPQLVRLVSVNEALSSAALSLNSSFINIGLSLGAFSGGIMIDQVGVGSLPWLGVVGTGLSMIIFGVSWVMENSAREAVAV